MGGIEARLQLLSIVLPFATIVRNRIKAIKIYIVLIAKVSA